MIIVNKIVFGWVKFFVKFVLCMYFRNVVVLSFFVIFNILVLLLVKVILFFFGESFRLLKGLGKNIYKIDVYSMYLRL